MLDMNRFFLGGLGLALLVLGCGEAADTPSAEASVPGGDTREADSAAAAYAPVFAVDSFRGQAYGLYQVDPRREDLRIYNLDADGRPHTFASLASLAQAEGKALAFAMNGGMFQPDRSAQGLLVCEGQVVQPLDTLAQGYGNFYLQPNGVFALDTAGRGYVVTTAWYDSLAQQTAIAYATQSGPMMLVDSAINPLFTDGSANLYVRNAVGYRPDGQLVFALSQAPISFFDLSSVLLRRGCTQALYLDGFVSQVYLPTYGLGQLVDGDGLGPLIALFRPR